MKKQTLRAACALALGVGLAAPALAQVQLDFDTSAPVPQPWYLNDVHTISFVVTNTGMEASRGAADEFVHFSLPLETGANSWPAECTGPGGGPLAPGAQFFDCTIPPLAVGASHTYTFDIEGIALFEDDPATNPGHNRLDLRFSAIPEYYTTSTDPARTQHPQQFFTGLPIDPITGEPAGFYIIPQAPTPPAPSAPVSVPTLDFLGLGLLAAGVGLIGARRRRTQA